MRVPDEISTGCAELDLAWAAYASMILERSEIPIPDTDEDLNWHAFLGHSIDMQGFRAAEFVGVDPLPDRPAGFIPIRERGISVPQLAALWDTPAIRDHLRTGTEGEPLRTSLDVLRRSGGAAGGSLADAFEWFPRRKFHWAVRALLENSATLMDHDGSFRIWLRDACAELGVTVFPPPNFRGTVDLAGKAVTLERALRARLEGAFYKVGPAMAAYMICDWQLWLWKEDRTAVFETFKLDSFHEGFVKRFGRGVISEDEAGFARWWLDLYPEIPPRLPNECIWLGTEYGVVDPSEPPA